MAVHTNTSKCGKFALMRGNRLMRTVVFVCMRAKEGTWFEAVTVPNDETAPAGR